MKIKLLAATLGLAVATQSSATVLFADDFQTNLAQWSTNLSGVIVAAPVGTGNALAFTSPGSGGDLFQAGTISSLHGNFTLTFDYLGTCGTSSCGGFIGFNNPAETWLAGSGYYPTPHPLLETGAWQTVSLSFASASPIKLKLEDFVAASDGGATQNAYFRNLSVSGSVPEPASWALLITGFALTGLTARRRSAVTA